MNKKIITVLHAKSCLSIGLCHLSVSEARVENEESHKFVYVVKGPTSAQQKKVFYVYGKGWNAKDGTVTRPTTTKEMGKDPTWPLRQQPHDVYYDITFLDQGKQMT